MNTTVEENMFEKILFELSFLNEEKKLDLIGRIAKSLKKPARIESKNNFEKYVGKLPENEAKKMISDIETSRQKVSRPIINLD